MLCTKKPLNAAFSADFVLWNISDASVGTEELAHLEMIGAIVYQLTRNLSMDEIQKNGFDKYYVDHTLALWPQAAGGVPSNANQFQSKGDIITDLHEDMAADDTRHKHNLLSFSKLKGKFKISSE